MTDEAAQKVFTKAMLDQVMQSVYAAGNQPTTFIVSGYTKAVFVVYDTAKAERWNWRRTKRELRRIGLVRKGVRREYHKRAA